MVGGEWRRVPVLPGGEVGAEVGVEVGAEVGVPTPICLSPTGPWRPSDDEQQEPRAQVAWLPQN